MVNKNVRQIRSQNDTNLLHSESMYQTQIIQIAILQMCCKSRVRSLVTTSSFPFCVNWRWIRNIPFHPVTRSHPLERQGQGADTLKTTQPHPPENPPVPWKAPDQWPTQRWSQQRSKCPGKSCTPRGSVGFIAINAPTASKIEDSTHIGKPWKIL